MTAPDALQQKIARLEHKVRLLEEMVEENSRTAFLEGQRRAAINAMLALSLQSSRQAEFLSGCLDILLAQELFAIEGRGALFLTEDDDVRLAVEQDFPQAKVCCAAEGSLCRRAARSGMLLFSAAAAQAERRRCATGLPTGVDVCAVPVRLGQQVLGVFCLALPSGMVPSQADNQFLAAAADIVAGGLQRFRYEDDLAVYQVNLEELVTRKIEELRQAEERYRDIFTYSQAGIYQSWLDGGFRTCNPAMARMLGYDSPETLMAAVTDIASQLYVDPSDRERLIAQLREGPVQGVVTRLRKRDGSVIHVLLSTRLVTEGTDLPYLEGQALDITDRVRAEAALAEERNRLAVTLASIGDGVITTDTDGRILLCNPVAEQLTGWSQAEAVGRSLTEVLRLVDTKDERPLPDPVAAILERDAMVTLERDCLLISRDGRRLLIADSGAPIRDADGRNIGVVLVFRDITEQTRLEQEARRNQRLESLGVLAGGIAHDFNNILVAILGNISLAERLVSGQEKVELLLAEARKAGLRARDLVRRLQTFAKGGDPIREAAAIDEVIRESADFVLRGSNVACRYDFAPDLWLADIDSGQVSQVIQNLVINAKQAMPDGGTVTITCRNREERPDTEDGTEPQRFIEVSVADDGPGIPADRLPHIFDPYFTTKEEGTGLGLAIVHSVIRKHGGNITVESSPGQGTRFTFLLPASQKEETTVSSPPTTSIVGGSGRILVMDDDEAIRLLAVNMLGFLGYEAETVVDGEDAVARYQEALTAGRPFAAVILDLTVPGRMGGREAGERILAMDPTARIIITSGYARERVLASYRQYGFAGILVKPFLAGEMDRLLRTVLATPDDQ